MRLGTKWVLVPETYSPPRAPRRRLCRDYERSTAHAEDLITIAMIRPMAASLTGHQTPYRNIRPAVA
jgi:hypothetical protein